MIADDEPRSTTAEGEVTERAFALPLPKVRAGLPQLALRAFVFFGVLPLLLIGMVIVFGSLEPRFLSDDNLLNVARQATYLMIVSMGQMIVLVSGGFDLSVGASVALTSVVSAMVMSDIYVEGSGSGPAIVLGIVAGLGIGCAVGVANGVGVSVLQVSPFIVTLGTASIGTGAALILTGGAPVTGLPTTFIDSLGTGRVFGVPAPVYVTAGLIVAMYVFLARTRPGRYVYAIGGNEKAARLSGVAVGRHLVAVYMISGLLASLAGILLTARVSTGEPNLGDPFILQSITAAVLGGVSLRGGEGRLSGVILGAMFIALLSNGMNLIRVQSFYQMVALGALLVFAVVMDRLRARVRRID